MVVVLLSIKAGLAVAPVVIRHLRVSDALTAYVDKLPCVCHAASFASPSRRAPSRSKPCFHLLPSKHRLALLRLDWSGARVSTLDAVIVGDYDEPQACRAAAMPLWSPHDLRHRRISLLHRQGRTKAEIRALVGRRSSKVTSDTYTHVLVDGRELDYAAPLATLDDRLLLVCVRSSSLRACTGACTPKNAHLQAASNPVRGIARPPPGAARRVRRPGRAARGCPGTTPSRAGGSSGSGSWGRRSP
jgi:hypothetical protein